MQTQKGIASVILVVVIIVLLVVAGFFAYQYYSTKANNQPQVQNNQQNQNQQQQTVNQQTNNNQPIDQTAGWKTYSLNACGITVKTNLAEPGNVFVAQGNDAKYGSTGGQIVIGPSLPNNVPNVPASILTLDCTRRTANGSNVADILSVQSDGAKEVNKNNYTVFNNQTLTLITQLYSAKNRGYRNGSETVGFENQDWIYTFSFLNPEQSRNQNSFIISVNQ